MDDRERCLTKNKNLMKAVASLLTELEGDYTQRGLEACSLCKLGLDKPTAINLHCQLKSVHDVLDKVVKYLSTVKDKNSS